MAPTRRPKIYQFRCIYINDVDQLHVYRSLESLLCTVTILRKLNAVAHLVQLVHSVLELEFYASQKYWSIQRTIIYR